MPPIRAAARLRLAPLEVFPQRGLEAAFALGLSGRFGPIGHLVICNHLRRNRKSVIGTAPLDRKELSAALSTLSVAGIKMPPGWDQTGKQS